MLRTRATGGTIGLDFKRSAREIGLGWPGKLRRIPESGSARDSMTSSQEMFPFPIEAMKSGFSRSKMADLEDVAEKARDGGVHSL